MIGFLMIGWEMVRVFKPIIWRSNGKQITSRRSSEKPSKYALNLLHYNNNPEESLRKCLVKKQTSKQTNKQTDRQANKHKVLIVCMLILFFKEPSRWRGRPCWGQLEFTMNCDM